MVTHNCILFITRDTRPGLTHFARRTNFCLSAHAVAKLKGILHRLFKIEVTIFVTGNHREGFPCEFDLSEALASEGDFETVDFNEVKTNTERPARAPRGSICVSPGSKSMKATRALRSYPKNRVCASLDEALQISEDILIAREDPAALVKENQMHIVGHLAYQKDGRMIQEEETRLAAKFLERLACSASLTESDARNAADAILSKAKREQFMQDDVVWQQGSESHDLKLVLSGRLVAHLEGTDIYEVVEIGNLVGELGLVQGSHRLSTLVCASDIAVTYTLNKAAWKDLELENPAASRAIDRIIIFYLSMRVMHVSNRIFETRCLPI